MTIFHDTVALHAHFLLKSVLVFVVLVLFNTAAFPQERRPLSVADIEDLFRAGVSRGRLAALVRERGVSFGMTEEVKERLKMAGADAEVIKAVEAAAGEYARRKTEKESQREEREKQEMAEVYRILGEAGETARTAKEDPPLTATRRSVLLSVAVTQVRGA